MPDDEEETKIDTHTAVARAKDIMHGSETVSFVILALPDDDSKGEEAYIEGDIESLAPLLLRFQHIMLKMLDATTVNVADANVQKKPPEGYT